MDNMVDTTRSQKLTTIRNQFHDAVHIGYSSALDIVWRTLQTATTWMSRYKEKMVEHVTTTPSMSTIEEYQYGNACQEEGQEYQEYELAFLHRKTSFFWFAGEFLGAVLKLYTRF
jgi:hypothetical protein